MTSASVHVSACRSSFAPQTCPPSLAGLGLLQPCPDFQLRLSGSRLGRGACVGPQLRHGSRPARGGPCHGKIWTLSRLRACYQRRSRPPPLPPKERPPLPRDSCGLASLTVRARPCSS